MEPNDFEQLVDAHYEALYRFAYSLSHSEADARDLTQQAFYVWAAKGHQLRDRSKVKTWLFTTLHRTFLEGCRKRQRYPHTTLDDVLSEDLPGTIEEPVHTADHAVVLGALARVDSVYQAAVVLFYLEDCSYQQIAEILEVPIGTVKSRMARGLGQLRKILLAETHLNGLDDPAAQAEGGSDARLMNFVRLA
jgi:RNA polymerase sigma-70 factor (ECF subfamily)